jgi:predicted outer membrane protein
MRTLTGRLAAALTLAAATTCALAADDPADRAIAEVMNAFV